MAEYPKFRNPPVVETVLGLQFTPLPEFTAAHAGLYWRFTLGDDWSKVGQEPRLEDEIEQFDDKGIWRPPGISFAEAPPLIRLQFTNDEVGRMVQVQNSRFVYNWRKYRGEYPTYESLLPEFCTQFEKFERFLGDEKLGSIQPKQWEVTYVNQISKGALWETPYDWEKIFPGLFCGVAKPAVGHLETVNMNWFLVIGDHQARLRASIRHVLIREPDSSEAIDFRFTVRGPIESSAIEDIRRAFDIGHDAIVRTFDSVTSAESQRYWGRLN